MELSDIKTPSPDWLSICGSPATDEAKTIHSEVTCLVDKGEFTWDEVAYISKVSMKAGGSRLAVTDQQLEKIRRACQVWDVDLHFKDLKSHRKLAGPLIVTAKKLLYPILKAFLKDFVRQQRSFNAATLALIMDLYSDKPQSPDEVKS